VAGADGGGELAQAEVADAVSGDVGDNGGEQARAGSVVRGHAAESTMSCTIRYVYHMVRNHLEGCVAKTEIVVERLIDAPAAVVYHCLADYREHHRPGGFLPPAFSNLHVERGGVGAGTRIRFTITLGGRTRTITQDVSEPDPGHLLVESGTGERTTFVVEPRGDRSLVRFETTLQARGLDGLLTRWLAPRLMRQLYADELERLERYAQAHMAEAAQLSTPG